jgi:hypothetical protein
MAREVFKWCRKEAKSFPQKSWVQNGLSESAVVRRLIETRLDKRAETRDEHLRVREMLGGVPEFAQLVGTSSASVNIEGPPSAATSMGRRR